MVETGEFSGGRPAGKRGAVVSEGQLSSVELVESDKESGVQSLSSSAITSSLLNCLHCPKSSELSRKRNFNRNKH